MRVALIHDWLLGMRGGEHCLEVLCSMFPEADIYTMFYDESAISSQITRHQVIRSSLSMLPGVKKYYRYLLPMYSRGSDSLARELAERHQQQPYDLVVSVSHCAAKNVKVPEGVPHISYCLTPMRYIWDQYARYFEGRLIEPFVRQIVGSLRRWDVAGSANVGTFVGISHFVADRIKRYYDRDAEVIYPPVRTDWLDLEHKPERCERFLCVNALVPYKNTELIVRAFNGLPYELLVVGVGPEEKKLRRIARKNIRFTGFVDRGELAYLYKSSRALVFAAEEDFGMTPVEMQATGGPVIAFGRGGVLETVVASGETPTGVFFPELTTASLKRGVEEFISRQAEFTVDNCVKQAQLFSLKRFTEEFESLLFKCGVSAEKVAMKQQA